ncbi:MAG: hypothetical protein NZ551_08325 [Microscillaceae bacterium]|nr:hypothetical protein [Microscillaceae bacterium]MDW8461204.1 hypothetical protein [Cytophagales bacterium]
MSKILSLVKNVSLFGALLVLVLAYSDLSRNEVIHLYFNLYDVSQMSVSKDVFFYVPTSFIVVFNLLLIILTKVIKQAPVRMLPVAHKSFWLKDTQSQFYCREMFMSWLLSLGFWVNIGIIFFIVRVWKINRAMKGIESDYASLFYGSIVVLVIWLIAFLIRINLKKYELIE